MEKRLILNFKELHLIGVECDNCKTTVLLNVAEDMNMEPPQQCSRCGCLFYEIGQDATPLRKLIAALRAIQASTGRLTAHITNVP
jgi:hypothetical protein